MIRDYDFDNDDYPTAVAAASFAVHSLDQSKSRGKNVKNYDHGKSLNKTRSKAEKRKSAVNFSEKQVLQDPDIKMPENKVGPSPSLEPKISFFDTNENPEWMGRPSALEDKHLKDDDRKSPESPLHKPDSPPIGNQTARPVGTTRQSTNKPGPRDSLADAWEKEEMASIKERLYDRLKDTIDNWETKRKKKADRKLETNEVKPNKSREKAVQSHYHEIKRIKEIADEARAQAESKRIKEEMKVKEKANKIRNTGKLPTTCLCF
ncbi:hypothetical protein CASFOL_020746 [Castilleja foliolosa]|uniref:Remorin C-terminal domain-containing protein n=1 Tax=Castilleja foliolosa TaxID=1961234 RepID=A0ABD3D4J0_9LAMI